MFVVVVHLQQKFGMRQGEGGPDPEELPAAQVLGHGLWVVFSGLRRRGQRHCLQELEPATWVATCGYASSGDFDPPTWLTTQIHPCVEANPRPRGFGPPFCLVQQVWNDRGLATQRKSRYASHVTGSTSAMAFRLEGYHQGEFGSESFREAFFLVFSFLVGAYACGLLIDKNQVP